MEDLRRLCAPFHAALPPAMRTMLTDNSRQLKDLVTMIFNNRWMEDDCMRLAHCLDEARDIKVPGWAHESFKKSSQRLHDIADPDIKEFMIIQRTLEIFHERKNADDDELSIVASTMHCGCACERVYQYFHIRRHGDISVMPFSAYLLIELRERLHRYVTDTLTTTPLMVRYNFDTDTLMYIVARVTAEAAAEAAARVEAEAAAEVPPDPMAVEPEPQPDPIPEVFTYSVRREDLMEYYNDGEPFTLERWNHLHAFLMAEFNAFYENGVLRDEFEEYIREQQSEQGNSSTTAPEGEIATSTQQDDIP